MKKIFLITLAILIYSATNFFNEENFFSAEKFAEAKQIFLQTRKPASENFAEEVLELVNIEREKVGVKPLELSQDLMEFSAIRAEEIAEVFSHTRPDGSGCFTVINIPYRHIGENIAEGQPTAEDVVEAWMNSEGHRKNILNSDFGKLGVGYKFVADSEYNHYWVQLFKD